MSDETNPTWGYSKDGDKIFDLKEGESLPKGYYAHPAMVPGSEAQKKKEADDKAEGIVGDKPATPDAPKVTGL